MAEIRDELFYKQKNGYDTMSTQQRIDMEDYCRGYMAFLNEARTEREAVKIAIEMAEDKGFVEYVDGMKLSPGDKVYCNNRSKALMLAVIGRKSLEEGCVIAGAHVDSPRIDLKQNPLYESDELAYFKTHYYGGIKKYQWVTIPLELHGVVALKNGETIDVSIGHDPSDPQFVITDLLPHLGKEQMRKTMEEGITGEGLEEDFLSAELTAVPAFEVREIGLDRSLIGGYGHDDRVCAYAELKAILELDEAPEKTAVCILADKEETGSDGVSGMQSSAFECFMEELCAGQNVPLRRCFKNSFCLSADVTAAFDPNFPEVSEKRNDAKLNYGMGICKFTGARGKSGTSDASAEIVGYLRRIFADAGVVWQMSELGKVDQGGGGTIAKYMANRNIDTIDAGVPVMSMHAPFEVVAKFDCFMTYLGVLAAYKA